MNKSNIYYGVSVSDRNYFHKPITHYPMLKAIEYCKAMDKKKFILGDIYENQSTHSDKEKSIANFKRYFTNIIENYICFDGVIKYS